MEITAPRDKHNNRLPTSMVSTVPSCGPIEFTDNVTMLYRLYGIDGCLLRIGVTRSLLRRMSEYEEEAFWWDDVARKTVVAYSSREDAEAAETAAIRAEHPLYNVRERCNMQLTAGQWEQRQMFEAMGCVEGPHGAWTRRIEDIPLADRHM